MVSLLQTEKLEAAAILRTIFRASMQILLLASLLVSMYKIAKMFARIDAKLPTA